MFCYPCGERLLPEAQFCHKCGANQVSPPANEASPERAGRGADLRTLFDRDIHEPVNQASAIANPLFEEAARLWAKAFEDGWLDADAEFEVEVVLGAYYAKLALDGTVKLTDSGLEKVESAIEVLREFLGGERN